MVVEDVVEAPKLAKFVEALILDAPACVSQKDDGFGRGLVAGEGGSPYPVVGFRFCPPLTANPPTTSRRLQGANDSHGEAELFPAGQTLDIPLLVKGFPSGKAPGGFHLEKTASVPQKFPLLVLDNDDDVLVLSAQHLDHRGSGVETVHKDHRERSRNSPDDPQDQSKGRRYLILPGGLQFEIEEQLKLRSQKLRGYNPMVVLQLVLVPYPNVPHAAPVATPAITGRQLVPVQTWPP